MNTDDWTCRKCTAVVLARFSNCRRCGELKSTGVTVALSTSSIGSNPVSEADETFLSKESIKRRDDDSNFRSRASTAPSSKKRGAVTTKPLSQDSSGSHSLLLDTSLSVPLQLESIQNQGAAVNISLAVVSAPSHDSVVSTAISPALLGHAPEYANTRNSVTIFRDSKSNIPTSDRCIVCLDDIKCYAVGLCNHRDQCSRCYMISLKQYNRQTCVTCKAASETFEPVILTRSRTKPHSQFNISTLTSSKHYRGTFFEDRKEMQKFLDLFQAKCPLCGQTFRDLKELKGHVKNEHNKQFCSVCIEKRKGIFPYQQRLYDKSELQNHKINGDPPRGDDGAIPVHLPCRIDSCSEICYDQEDLHNHMIDKHICCQICRRIGNETWLKDARLLLHHYKTDHFICSDRECLERPLENVFIDEIALKGHIISKHTASFSSKQALKDAQRLSLQFRARPEISSNNSSEASNRGSSINTFPANWDQSPTPASASAAATPAVVTAANPGSGSNARTFSAGNFPTDPREQNQLLISEIKRLTGDVGFTKFRGISGDFFHKKISANVYYSYFCDMFGGTETAGPLWALLVASNPDPNMRAELYQTHYVNKSNGGDFAQNKIAIPGEIQKYEADNTRIDLEKSGVVLSQLEGLAVSSGETKCSTGDDKDTNRENEEHKVVSKPGKGRKKGQVLMKWG